MTRLKAVTTIFTQDEIALRWARKAPSRTKHYARRGILYAGGVTKMVILYVSVYFIVIGSLKVLIENLCK
jgi:hypothetical protein